MEAVKSKLGILIALLLCVTVIGTCTFLERPGHISPPPYQDSTFVREWKQEKLALQKHYETRIADLQTAKDSLQRIANEKKKAMVAYRSEAKVLQEQLRQALTRIDSVPFVTDTILPIAENYFASEAASDSSCMEAIRSLEQIVINRDSTICLYKKNEANQRDLQREQMLREQQLTEQLNTAYKVQRKKILQNKFLAGGLVFITGFTATLLINQKLK